MLLYYYKCEQKKFLYQKWNIIVLFGILLLVPVMVLTLGSYAGETGKLLSKSKLIQGFYLGQAGYTVLTALYFGNEYQRSALRTSLLSTPNRGMFLISKFLCILTWSLILLSATSVISIIALKLSLNESLSVNELLYALIPAFLSTVELVIITGGIVILTRSMIVSMAVIVSLILGLGNILLQYSAEMKYLPVLSTMNGFMIMNVPHYLSINTGIIIQAIWSVALLMSAFFIFSKRDVRY